MFNVNKANYEKYIKYVCDGDDFFELEFEEINTALEKHKLAFVRLFLGFYHKLSSCKTKEHFNLANIDSLHKECVAKTLSQSHQVKELVNYFSKENVSFLLLKGSALDQFVERQYRISNDVDLLVSQNDKEKAIAILSNKMEYFDSGFGGALTDFYEMSFRPRGMIGYSVDLHFNLIHPFIFQIKEQDLFKYSTEHKYFKSDKVRVLCIEHNILHLALHGFKDLDFKKYGLADFYFITKNNHVDWDFLYAEANNWGCTTPLYYLLSASKTVLEYEPNKEALELVKPNKIRKFFSDSAIYLAGKNIKPMKKVVQLLSFLAFSANTLGVCKLCLSYVRRKL